MPMGHGSNAKCHIDPDLYGISHLTRGPLAFGFMSSGRAWLRGPAGVIRNFLEVLAHDPGFAEILWISEFSDHGEPLITVRSSHAVVILRQIRVRTVGNPVLARISRAQACRCDP